MPLRPAGPVGVVPAPPPAVHPGLRQSPPSITPVLGEAHHPGMSRDTKFVTNRKTQICMYWREGRCTRGTLCSFAHGDDELTRESGDPRDMRDQVKEQFMEEAK